MLQDPLPYLALYPTHLHIAVPRHGVPFLAAGEVGYYAHVKGFLGSKAPLQAGDHALTEQASGGIWGKLVLHLAQAIVKRPNFGYHLDPSASVLRLQLELYFLNLT